MGKERQPLKRGRGGRGEGERAQFWELGSKLDLGKNKEIMILFTEAENRKTIKSKKRENKKPKFVLK